MSKKFYITAAIPYVNAKPHIGHALEFVQTNTIARYHKLLGQDVLSPQLPQHISVVQLRPCGILQS